jgi:hypothetical protein
VADRSGRAYGSLALLTDSERRGLRPIGASVREVADRTAMLFDTVMKKSRNVRLFRAVCADGRDALRIPHVICAGRRVILVDSVTWPPGAYTVAESGHVHCDGQYIGQSVAPLACAVAGWREMLPDGHLVTGLVVVHPNGEGGIGLYGDLPSEVGWSLAHDAVHDVCRLLPPDSQRTSSVALARLRDASGSPTTEVPAGSNGRIHG